MKPDPNKKTKKLVPEIENHPLQDNARRTILNHKFIPIKNPINGETEYWTHHGGYLEKHSTIPSDKKSNVEMLGSGWKRRDDLGNKYLYRTVHRMPKDLLDQRHYGTFKHHNPKEVTVGYTFTMNKQRLNKVQERNKNDYTAPTKNIGNSPTIKQLTHNYEDKLPPKPNNITRLRQLFHPAMVFVNYEPDTYKTKNGKKLKNKGLTIGYPAKQEDYVLQEEFKPPEQTIHTRDGDCEDYAILFAEILKYSKTLNTETLLVQPPVHCSIAVEKEKFPHIGKLMEYSTDDHGINTEPPVTLKFDGKKWIYLEVLEGLFGLPTPLQGTDLNSMQITDIYGRTPLNNTKLAKD